VHPYSTTLTRRPVALLVKTADVAANLNPDRVAHLDDATRERLDATEKDAAHGAPAQAATVAE